MERRTLADTYGINIGSFWPSDRPLDNSDLGLPVAPRMMAGEWRLDISRTGLLSVRERSWPSFDGQCHPVYYLDDADKLGQLQVLTCQLDGRKDPRLVMEKGDLWYFNWLNPLPGTVWQINAVCRLLHLALKDSHRGFTEAQRLQKLLNDAASQWQFKHPQELVAS